MQQPEPETYHVSNDKSRLDLDMIHRFLSTQSYWAEGIPRELVEKSIRGSYCYGVYCGDTQAGFARVVSDGATFGYLADVFVLPEHRGRGLARRMMEVIMSDPDLRHLRRWMLVTRDAHDLYRPFGFTEPDLPGRIMQYRPFTRYAPADEAQNKS